MRHQLPDGVYIGLDFDEYVEQDAIGGTNKATLWLKAEGYYWRYLSPFKTARKSTPEQLFGTALHAALLEGMHAFETRFCVKPDKADYDDLLVTKDDIQAALRKEGVHLSGTSAFKKEDWAEAAEIHLPDYPCWDNINAEFERRHNGRQPLSAFDDFCIRAMRNLATEDHPDNAEMREIMSVGSTFPILSEISILYTDKDGLRHRARFDKLLPVATIDLKSVGEWQGRPLTQSLHDHITKNGYDVQLADYHVARQAMNRMILADPACIHGGTAEIREHLEAMARWNQTNPWGWLWAFYQKPTLGGNAPILFPLRDPWKGPYHLAGFRKRHVAMETYRRCMARFGPGKPWGRVEPVHWVDEGEEHHISTSQFGWGPDDPVEGEAEHFGYKA